MHHHIMVAGWCKSLLINPMFFLMLCQTEFHEVPSNSVFPQNKRMEMSTGITLNTRFCRGVSSTVRRVVEKETGQEYAAKVIDLTGDKDTTDDQLEEFRAATIKEMMILRVCADHHHISK